MPNQNVKTLYKKIKTPIKKVKTPFEVFKNSLPIKNLYFRLTYSSIHQSL